MVSARGIAPEDVDQYRARVAADCIIEAFHLATADYWRRRADTLEWAKPKPGEYHGRSTVEERRKRWRELDQQAKACRNRARVAEMGGEVW